MPSTSTDRIYGISASVAVKAPCRVATTANITLSGLQTIDGVSVSSGDRVLVKNQTDEVDNGIWVVSPSSWTRDADFDGHGDIVNGTIVFVNEGTTNTLSFWHVSGTDPIAIGTDNITFTAGTVGVANATETVPGLIEIATQAEVNAGTDNQRAVTPLKLAAVLPVGATTSQAQAATNDTAFMSPADVKAQLDYRGRALNPKDYGAKCDAIVNNYTVSITSGQATLTATGATFTSSDVGKLISIAGAGAAGAVLTTTILSFTDATHVTLAANAGTTVTATSKIVAYGTDDLTAWNACLTAASANSLNPLPVEFLGRSAVSGTITIPNVSNLSISGLGGGRESGAAGVIGRSVASKIVWIGGNTSSYIMSAGNGGVGNSMCGLRLRNFGLDGVYISQTNVLGLGLNQQVQNSVFEGLLISNVHTGINVLASCFSNVYRDIDFFACSNYGINLKELDHAATIQGCTFANYDTDTDTPICIAIGTGGSGSFHSSEVLITGNNFNNYRALYWIDAQDAHAVNIIGNYFEGNDNTMVAGIRFGQTADANKKVDSAVVIGNRITTAITPAATAIDCQRVSGVLIGGNYFNGWTTSCLRIDHTNSNNIVWSGNDYGSLAIYDADGAAITIVGRPAFKYFSTGNIADDGVFSFTPYVNSGKIALLTVNYALSYQGEAIYIASVGAAGMIAGAVGSQFTVNTTPGALTGTTGTDGNVTIRANSADGKIYIENRTGSTRNFTYYISML